MDNSAEIPPNALRRSRRGCLNGLFLLVPIFLFSGFAIWMHTNTELERDTVTAPLILPTGDPNFEQAVSNALSGEEADPTDTVVAETTDAETSDIADADSDTYLLATASDTIDRLVVVTERNQLLTIAPDGTDARALTTVDDRISYLFPAWSPTGSQIAAIGAGRNKPDGIFILDDSAETDPNQVFADIRTPIYLYWSPDGEGVAFIVSKAGDTTLLDLRYVPADGSARSRYLAFGQPLYWDFESTSDTILFSTNRSTHAEFAYVNRADGEIGEAVAEASGLFQSPDISFDDAYIAYGGGTEDALELIIENRESGAQTSAEHVGGIAFTWSPTANVLAYISSNEEAARPFGPMRLLDTNGSIRNLVDDDVIAFFWSPDGNKIAYVTVSGRNTNQDARNSRTQLGKPAAQSRVLMLELWVIEPASGEKQLLGSVTPGRLFVTQFLPFFDQYARSHSIWSPDSSAVVMPIRDDTGETVIYRFPLDGTGATKVVEGQSAFWSRR